MTEQQSGRSWTNSGHDGDGAGGSSDDDEGRGGSGDLPTNGSRTKEENAPCTLAMDNCCERFNHEGSSIQFRKGSRKGHKYACSRCILGVKPFLILISMSRRRCMPHGARGKSHEVNGMIFVCLAVF